MSPGPPGAMLETWTQSHVDDVTPRLSRGRRPASHDRRRWGPTVRAVATALPGSVHHLHALHSPLVDSLA
jgi:hypothetical protein